MVGRSEKHAYDDQATIKSAAGSRRPIEGAAVSG